MNYFESETMELKSELNKEIIKEIIAMLNSKGGSIYIGVQDDGTVCGVNDAKETIEKISNMISDSIEPSSNFMTSFSVIKENEDKDVVKIEIVKGSNPPYYIKSKGLNEKGVFVRVGSTSRPSSIEDIKSMLIQSKNFTFETNLSINQDLTFDYFKNILNKNNIELTENLELTLGIKNEQNCYTNLGLIISDNCPFTIKLALYQDTSLNSFYDRKEFDGSILKQIDSVIEYLNLINRVSGEIIGMERVDKYDYPIESLRESIINSVIHKDYSLNTSTLIHIFTDRIQISSIGGIYGNIPLETILKGGISITRNPKLQTILLRLKKVESLGTGISRIMKSYENNIIKPSIEVTDSSFTIVIPKLSYGSEETQMIIEYLNKYDSITREEIEKILGISKTNAIQKINKMIEDGVLKSIGNGRGIKYIRNI